METYYKTAANAIVGAGEASLKPTRLDCRRGTPEQDGPRPEGVPVQDVLPQGPPHPPGQASPSQKGSPLRALVKSGMTSSDLVP